jgi:hypothetical protein
LRRVGDDVRSSTGSAADAHVGTTSGVVPGTIAGVLVDARLGIDEPDGSAS